MKNREDEAKCILIDDVFSIVVNEFGEVFTPLSEFVDYTRIDKSLITGYIIGREDTNNDIDSVSIVFRDDHKNIHHLLSVNDIHKIVIGLNFHGEIDDSFDSVIAEVIRVMSHYTLTDAVEMDFRDNYMSIPSLSDPLNALKIWLYECMCARKLNDCEPDTRKFIFSSDSDDHLNVKDDVNVPIGISILDVAAKCVSNYINESVSKDDLVAILKLNNIINKFRYPKKLYVDRGYMDVINNQLLFTEKGLIWLQNNIKRFIRKTKE